MAVLTTRFTSLACFQHIQWRPDERELRRFALWMLGGFAVLGGLGAWRSGTMGTASLVLWVVGLTLAACTLVPGLGRAAYLAVYLASGLIGFVVARIVLTLIFYLVFMPIGLWLWATGHDILRRRRPDTASMWLPRSQRKDLDSYYRQF